MIVSMERSFADTEVNFGNARGDLEKVSAVSPRHRDTAAVSTLRFAGTNTSSRGQGEESWSQDEQAGK